MQARLYLALALSGLPLGAMYALQAIGIVLIYKTARVFNFAQGAIGMTCAFVASAKKDSIDTLLSAADTGAKVVATGCMAERYGRELASSLPEAHAVLGFDDYPDISARLHAVLAGEHHESHVPRDRRTLLSTIIVPLIVMPVLTLTVGKVMST